MFALKVLFYKTIILLLRVVARFIPQVKPLLYCGEGSSLQLCDAIAHSGASSLLLVTDKQLMGLGLLENINQRLAAHGITVSVYDGVLPDPTTIQVEQAATICRTNHCDAVLGVGGGSVLDTAKAVAALVAGEQQFRAMVGLNKVKNPPLPLYVVPTTAGTGSEVTLAAVISDPETHEKLKLIDPKLVPKAAALDVSLMLGMPPSVTAATGMDALTHAVEAYLSGMHTDETDQFAVQSIRLILEALPKAYRDGKDKAAREKMAMAAMYAGFAFSRANVGYVHAFAHSLGARYGIPHGQANAMLLPGVLRYYQSVKAQRLTALATALGLSANDAGVEALIDAIEQLAGELGIPVKVAELQGTDIEQIAREAAREAHYFYAVPSYMPPGKSQEILHSLLPE